MPVLVVSRKRACVTPTSHNMRESLERFQLPQMSSKGIQQRKTKHKDNRYILATVFPSSAEKSRIQETKHLSTNAVTSTDTTERKNSKMSRNMPKLAIHPSARGLYPSGSMVSRWTKNTLKPESFETENIIQNTPHRTASQGTTPHRTAPHRTALHRTAPHRTAPHRAQRAELVKIGAGLLIQHCSIL